MTIHLFDQHGFVLCLNNTGSGHGRPTLDSVVTVSSAQLSYNSLMTHWGNDLTVAFQKACQWFNIRV